MNVGVCVCARIYVVVLLCVDVCVSVCVGVYVCECMRVSK